MERHSGLMMSREKGSAVFLTASGEFVRGRPVIAQAKVGDEVDFFPVRFNGVRWSTVGLVASLVLALLVTGSFYFTKPAVAAYVTVDINPSVELAVDKHDVVRSAVALDDEAQNLLKSVNLVGKPVTQAVSEITGAAARDGYFKAEEENLVVITATSVKGEASGTDALNKELEESVKKVIPTESNTHVEAMSATIAQRQEAQKQGISVGKLMIAQKAEEAGLHLDPSELKTNSIANTIRSAGGNVGSVMSRKPEQGNATPAEEQKAQGNNGYGEMGSADDKKSGKDDNGKGNDKPKQNDVRGQDDKSNKQNGNGNKKK